MPSSKRVKNSSLVTLPGMNHMLDKFGENAKCRDFFVENLLGREGAGVE